MRKKSKTKRHRRRTKTKQKKQWRTPPTHVLVVCGLVAGLVAFALFFVNAYRETVTKAPIAIAYDPNLGIEPYVTDFFTANGAEDLLPVIACESNFKHFDGDGDILKNRGGSSAIGVAQILTSVHPDPKVIAQYNRRFNTNLTTEDFDLTTLQDNIGYALILYEIRGTRDWECAQWH